MLTKIFRAIHLRILAARRERSWEQYHRHGSLRLLAKAGRDETEYVRTLNRYHPLY